MNNMKQFFFEADDYSNYGDGRLNAPGQPYNGYTGAELNESSFFAQGGMEACVQNVVEPLDRTLTFRVTNTGAAASAILFDGNVNPLVQPAGITVTVAETGGGAGSHDQVRTESIGNPFAIQGARYFVGNSLQFANAWTIQKQNITGGLRQYLWQPSNYVSPTNLNPLVIDAVDFGLVIDGRTAIFVPIEAGTVEDPQVITIVFTVKAKTNMNSLIFGSTPKSLAVAPRGTGNPIADIQLIRSTADRQLM